MTIETLKEAAKRGHEQVVFFNYPKAGLKAIIAIHSTVLGPALGGCRMRFYETESQAIDDVMRLSEGMTYKNSLAGLDLGGGKSCIIADPAMTEGRRGLFLKFGECLNDLGGRYVSAEDMGTSVKDIMVVKEVCKYLSGTAIEDGGGGDPSPWTARGVYRGILAACERRFGSSDLKGRTVSIQGVGHVGMYLAGHLHEAGAKLIVSDTSPALAKEARDRFGAEVADVNAIYDVQCDIYSPSAIGQTVNPDTIGRLKCAIIAGAANNQLPDSSVYSLIEERKIIYCPDFAINAGGVINCASEYRSEGWQESWTAEKVDNIYNTIHRVLERAEKEKKFPEAVALELARERIQKAADAGKA